MNDFNENIEAIKEHRMSAWWRFIVIILISSIGLTIIGFVFKANIFGAGFEAVFTDIFAAIRRTIGF